MGLTAGGSGFDPLGVTAPSGRNDITGHLDDSLAWTKGAHQLKFGGELRQAQVDDFYQTGERGTIYFDGSQGPWATLVAQTPAQACARPWPPGRPIQQPACPPISTTSYLADFLAGCFDPTPSEIVLGNPKRQVFVNTFALSAQDSWKITKRLSFDYGLRYDYEGPVHSNFPNLSVFDPSQPSGLAVVGQQAPNLWSKFWGGASPRVGFAVQVDSAAKTVLRGGYGLYYDSIYMKSVLQNNGAQNISVFGPGLNPAGSEQVAQASGLAGTVIANRHAHLPHAEHRAGRAGGQPGRRSLPSTKTSVPATFSRSTSTCSTASRLRWCWQVGLRGYQGHPPAGPV